VYPTPFFSRGAKLFIYHRMDREEGEERPNEEPDTIGMENILKIPGRSHCVQM
jgi:hypothetical protein